MTAVLDRTNQFSAPFDNIFSVLDNRTNIADPRDGTGARKFVYDSEPFYKAVDFSSFPHIYLKSPKLTKTNISADGKHKNLNYTQTVFIRSVKNGSGPNRADAGHADMQAIVNDTLETFDNETIKQSLRVLNMHSLNAEITDSDDGVVSQRPIFETEIELTYYVRLEVSA